jgi:hypothetical protein
MFMTKEIVSQPEDLLLGFDTLAARDRFISDVLTTGVGCFVTKHEDSEVKQTRLDPQDLKTKETYPFSE